jgi:hypothetical protein
MKKVLLLIVDGCTPRVLEPAPHGDQLPHVLAVREASFVEPAGSTIFPSLTPAALTSLVTGVYPCQHGILGTHWYDEDEDEAVHYDAEPGSGFGTADFTNEDEVQLSQDRLQVQTLFQLVKEAGLQTTSFIIDAERAADPLIQMAQSRTLPDLTAVYFPLYQRDGDQAEAATLMRFDRCLGDMSAAYGSLETLLHDACLIITAGHARSQIDIDEENAVIQADNVLADFTVADTDQPWHPDDDLRLYPNGRALQIYFQDLELELFHTVIARLQADERIDQVMWRADITEEYEKGYRVATSERKALHFWPGASGPNTGTDQQGCAWSWAGSLGAVDGRLSQEKTLSFPTYPNAFERIVGVLDCRHSGHLWATARLGHTFGLSSNHSQLSSDAYGSLHYHDSGVPFLIAGAPADVALPVHIRTIDVAPLCLSILDVASPRPVGACAINGQSQESRRGRRLKIKW